MILPPAHLDPLKNLSTGSLDLDIALGTGGIPPGHIVEIFGPASSGKSTLALHLLANGQKKGWKAVYIDVDRTLTPSYAQRCGVILSEARVVQPDTGEEALGLIYNLIKTAGVKLVVLDTIAALVPRSEYFSRECLPAGGGIYRLLRNRLRRLAYLCKEYGAVLICLNQTRFRFQSHLPPRRTTPGGLSLKLLATFRIELTRGQKIMEDSRVIGETIQARIIKNSLVHPSHSVKLIIVYNIGIMKCSDLLHYG